MLKDTLDQLGLKSGRDEPNSSQAKFLTGWLYVRLQYGVDEITSSFLLTKLWRNNNNYGILWNLGIVILGRIITPSRE